jgi:putative addiction module component (TIGR02574 family)
MTSNFKELRKKAIELLPPEERAELAQALISSLEEKHDSKADSAWNTEIRLRVNEIKSGKAKGRPAEFVLAEIRAHYS